MNMDGILMDNSKFREEIGEFITIDNKILFSTIPKSLDLIREFKDRIYWEGVPWDYLLPSDSEEIKIVREFRPKND